MVLPSWAYSQSDNETASNPIGTCEDCVVEFLTASENEALAQRIAVSPGVQGICETLERGVGQTSFRDILIEINISPGTADLLTECLITAGIGFTGT